MHAALRGDMSRYRIVQPGAAIEPTFTEPWAVHHGRIVSKGLSDELAGRYYAVIETPGGGAYHVPIGQRAADGLRPGDLVAFESRPDDPDPRKPAAPPRHHVVVRKEPLGLDEQVRHRGSVLLDRLADRPLAPYGFGDELRRMLERRAEVLRGLGIDPADPGRGSKLEEVDRRAFGQELAARSAQSFLAETPAGFQGRVELVDRGEGRVPYTVVTDGTRFVLTPASPELRTRAGRVVALVRDRDGNLRAHDPDIDRGR